MAYKYPVYKPYFTGREKELVAECMNSTWISSKGRFINLFEKSFASYLGADHAVAVSNGTVGLHVALTALGIGPADEVLVPTLTYIASANAVSYTGAKVVFVDCEADYWQIDVAVAERRITEKTKAIIPVHLYGHVCDMEPLMKLAEKYSLIVIEDCAEAIGSKYKGKFAGMFGDIACFSFFGNKTITTGEGGMVVTNNSTYANNVRHLKGQGLVAGKEYWHNVIGFNYRMTNICAAIGCAQMEAIDDIIEKKQDIANWYREYLSDLPVRMHNNREDTYHSYWMVSILCDNTMHRDNLRLYLREYGVETRPLFYPVHQMEMYHEKNVNLPISEDIAYRGINLPSYPDLSRKDVFRICTHIKTYFDENGS
jgi:perosamine synthetase